jgi:hypothetical protein
MSAAIDTHSTPFIFNLPNELLRENFSDGRARARPARARLFPPARPGTETHFGPIRRAEPKIFDSRSVSGRVGLSLIKRSGGRAET